ncbi:isoprenylcysteine carboxylmethyltransferase family protein [Hyphomicrobium sp.]|jgi:protein-S-isoprenylcysteine O-methyltransferase Ste14|uniref:methyltransferase family protein n=1 Tax=Hyphomicrobium sp. TaxID=82 RepID=UPI0035684EC3
MTDQKSEPIAAATGFPWPPVLFVAAIAVAWTLMVFAPLPWPGLDDTAAHWVGLAFGAFGLLAVVSGFATLIAHRTTYLPNRASTRLVTTGPFAVFRNPIYLGEALLLLYGAEITQSIWFVAAALLFVILVTLLQIIPEERHLEAAFGDEYLAYKARSRRWI